MKLYRYMSKQELKKLLNHRNLKKSFDFSKAGFHTGSAGFCFLPKTIIGYGTKENTKFKSNPKDFLDSLYGIIFGGAHSGFLVEFSTKRHNVKKSWGIYSAPCTLESMDYDQKITEYCTTEYNRKNFRITKIFKVDSEKYYFDTFTRIF